MFGKLSAQIEHDRKDTTVASEDKQLEIERRVQLWNAQNKVQLYFKSSKQHDSLRVLSLAIQMLCEQVKLEQPSLVNATVTILEVDER